MGIAWERALSGKMSRDEVSKVASLFRNTDYLATRAFTIIHKIVLGLIDKDLDFELECTTADIDTPDSRGRTPLSWASARGDEHAVRILLKHDADIKIADACNQTPLHYAQNVEVAAALLGAGAPLAALNQDGQTPLYTACRNVGDMRLIEHFLAAGSDVNAVDFRDQTPLHAAISQGKPMPFIDTLLDAGADMNSRNDSHDTPLRFAVAFNMHHLLQRTLRAKKADFSGVNTYGQTFAHAIARTADLHTVEILMNEDTANLEADAHTRDAAGKTSLQYFDERLEILDVEEGTRLKEAFEALLHRLQKRGLAGDVSMVNEGSLDIKLHVSADVVSIVEDGEEDVDEEFHDAVDGLSIDDGLSSLQRRAVYVAEI